MVLERKVEKTFETFDWCFVTDQPEHFEQNRLAHELDAEFKDGNNHTRANFKLKVKEIKDRRRPVN
jgi:hypothetical protein